MDPVIRFECLTPVAGDNADVQWIHPGTDTTEARRSEDVR